jgi:hypothetical protein
LLFPVPASGVLIAKTIALPHFRRGWRQKQFNTRSFLLHKSYNLIIILESKDGGIAGKPITPASIPVDASLEKSNLRGI